MRKRNIFKHLFLFCLLAMTVALSNPTGHTTVSAASKASYKIINKKTTKRNNKLTARYLYQLPQLKGKSAAVKKINRSLKANYKATLSSKASLFDSLKNSPYSYYSGEYFYTTKCKVTYNKKGYVCFKFTCDWMAGGVHNGWEYGLTYRLKDGKKLEIQDVVSGDDYTINRKSQVPIHRKFPVPAIPRIMQKDCSEFQFYIKSANKVVVCFGSVSADGRKWTHFCYNQREIEIVYKEKER